MFNQKFDKDLGKGIKSEDGMVGMLKPEYPSIRRYEGFNKDYDLFDDEGNTWEVKSDIGSKVTENIAIEYQYKGEKSGIARTKAKYWIHIFKRKGKWVYVICEVEILKKFLIELAGIESITNGGKFRRATGGDNKDSKVYLVDKEYFIQSIGEECREI